ncbi:sensor histidine kinase YpdA [Clostridium tepidiprofundi DSM 19306]|uniref:Sensor histidine kinase YpdA n=1 Tax=Clostridium tepidiprofundi DSM 19306 TaxID=1121338 RepID=A0A151B250_9CLOT|nr:sensor histidine kinase [Clostridium tepidiprofundi]KYH33984.1 sensor histidine kinase YpdA [Clostridium tepidiprofundi DSM 19306]
MFKIKSFKKRLFYSFILIGICSLFFMALFSYYNTSKLINEKINISMENNIEVMGELIDSTISNLERIVEFISNNKDIQNILKKRQYSSYDEKFEDVQKVYTIVNSIEVKTMDIPIYITGLNNPYSRFTTQQSFEGLYSNVKGDIFNIFESFEKDRNFFIHRRVDGRESKDIVLTIVKRVKDIETDEKLGYVFLDVYDDYFNNIFKKVKVYENNNIYILDEHGNIITDKLYKNRTGFKFYENYLNKILNNVSGQFRCELSNGEYIAYFNTLGNTKFKIVQTVPIAVINKDKRVIVVTFVVLLSILTILAIIISYLLSQKISKPINELSKLMNKAENGDLNVKFDINCDDDIRDLGNNFNNMITEIDRLIEEVYIKQYLLKEAELKNLKAQINPHFLYNTLESIKWMAKLGENEGIVKMITALGRLLRYSISKKKDIVKVSEDIAQIKNYLTIQKIRYGDKFNIVYEIDEEILDKPILKLLLQPLVENAIIHGLEPKNGKGNILIKGYVNGDLMCFEVIDDGIGFDETTIESKGIGISNVDKRIKLHYGEEYGFYLKRVDNHTLAKLILPYDFQEDKVYVKSNGC